MGVADVNESNFEKEVLKSDIPVIVDVWAEWCVPCKHYSPVIEEVSKEYVGKIKFVKINAEENAKMVQEMDIMSMPTTLLVRSGQIAATSIGAISKDALKKWISKNGLTFNKR